MSFLSSILSTIGGDPSQPPTVSSRPPPPPPRQAKAPAPPKMDSPNGASTNTALKRKAEGEQDGKVAKSQRKDDSTKVADRPIAPARLTAPSIASKQQASSAPKPLPHRGTVKDANTLAAVAKSGVKPSIAVQKASTNPNRPQSKPATPITPTTSAAPKKGSYQEILARAKLLQEQQSQVGVIKHKKVEQVSKKDRATLQADAKGKGAPGKDTKLVRAGDNSGSKAKSSEPAKEKKKPVELGYSGTMRASAPSTSYKGTIKSGSGTKGRSAESTYRGTSAAGRHNGRLGKNGYYSDEMEEEDDYYSDASSDMEAAAFDLEEEESLSLRAAKKEDEEALKDEEEHKRKKEMRRKMLAKLAAENAKKRRF